MTTTLIDRAEAHAESIQNDWDEATEWDLILHANLTIPAPEGLTNPDDILDYGDELIGENGFLYEYTEGDGTITYHLEADACYYGDEPATQWDVLRLTLEDLGATLPTIPVEAWSLS